MFNSVLEHIECFLGEVDSGWSDEKSSYGIQVVLFKNQPIEGINTYVTLGLSEFILNLPKGRKIRQEIVISFHDSIFDMKIVELLFSLSENIIESGNAVLRGEKIELGGERIKNIQGIYITNPTPFDEGFAEFEKTMPSVVFALLIPVTSNELALIKNKGWNWFEDMLELQDPDIWDFDRLEEVTEFKKRDQV